jgi:hypothetical protein
MIRREKQKQLFMDARGKCCERGSKRTPGAVTKNIELESLEFSTKTTLQEVVAERMVFID